MRNTLHDRSLIWMRQTRPYHTEQVTAFMQVLSVVGDGDLYVFLVIGCCWCRGRVYDYNYLLLCIVLVCHWPNLLKQVLRDARP